jgi:predicted N-formylglutamate amidohydrolase
VVQNVATVSVQPFELFNPQGKSRMVFVCDHASNFIPPELSSLGLQPRLLETHIAFDIGAAAVTRAMAQAFDAPAVLGTHSRLLIDLNRGEDDPTILMKLSDGAIIPGNAPVGRPELAARIERYYRPYHAAVAAVVAGAKGRGVAPVIISIHSFTREWKGKARPWQIGVLWSHRDRRLSDSLLAVLNKEADLVVGDNQPYSGELEGDCMDQHALAHGLPHVLIEIRQDLIASQSSAEKWAARLVGLLERAITGMNGAVDPKER